MSFSGAEWNSSGMTFLLTRMRDECLDCRFRHYHAWHPRRRCSVLYDKQLSVNRNEACAFCHMPETGFTGPVSELNRTTGSYPGSVRTRFSNRKPQIARLCAALARAALQSRPG